MLIFARVFKALFFIKCMKQDIEKIKKAGRIAAETVAYARDLIKPRMKLLDIAEKLDAKILELGGKPAFPINLSINEVAAHSTPIWNSEETASGLLKVDLGVHVDGWCADTAFSLDLENNKENKNLIEAAESSLASVLEKVKKGIKLREIGKEIAAGIKGRDVLPIVNLSGHSIERYELHAGLTVPNYDNGSEKKLDDGLYAVEPFSTNGIGKVSEGRPSGIYQLTSEGNVRDNFAREVLWFISEEYGSLPFCSRWIYKKFGARGLLALKQIKQSGLLHEYAQLVEAGKGKVAQAEHSILVSDDGIIVTTKL